MPTLTQANLEVERLIRALGDVEGKAEIIHGELVHLPMTGSLPGKVSLEIAFSLRNYVRRVKRGFVVPDNVACLVDLPNRQSFAPDAAYHLGPDPGMKFFQGAPIFAAEVRSENDHGRAAERDMADKRADYFLAGTLVIWDVDILGANVIRVFRNGDAETPAVVFRRGDSADAEPAVPGWTMPVDDLFTSAGG